MRNPIQPISAFALLLSVGSILARRVTLSLVFLGVGLMLVPPHAVASGGFETTGSLNTARGGHTPTLLPNGKVLVAGGVNTSGVLASAELYDPGPPIITSPLFATATVGCLSAISSRPLARRR
jgi:hypothetical protein